MVLQLVLQLMKFLVNFHHQEYQCHHGSQLV
jgi:hypothetical protein